MKDAKDSHDNQHNTKPYAYTCSEQVFKIHRSHVPFDEHLDKQNAKENADSDAPNCSEKVGSNQAERYHLVINRFVFLNGFKVLCRSDGSLEVVDCCAD